MHKLQPGATVVTTEPILVVAPGLKPGIHRFQLVVVNDRQRQSHAAIHSVLVLKKSPASPPAKEEKDERAQKKHEPGAVEQKEPAKPKKLRRKKP